MGDTHCSQQEIDRIRTQELIVYTDLASIRNKLKNGMPKKRRKKALPPRVKRMDRSARLQSARSWLKTYNGRNIASGYRKHFGVDWVCAFRELEMLGVKVDSGYKSELLKCLEGHHRGPPAQKGSTGRDVRGAF